MDHSSLKQPKTLVILVNDKREEVVSAKSMIEYTGHPVIITDNPFEAISFVLSGLERPAIVVISNDMTDYGYTGTQLISHLDRIKVYPLLSILVSNKYDEKAFAEALDSGAIGLLSNTHETTAFQSELLMKYIHRADRLIQDELTLAERFDSLTGMYGVYDREGGRRKFRRVWREALKNRSITSAVFVDVNGLKAVNEQYGKEHGYGPGDRVIQALAKLLHFRSTDLVIRFGGDEFFVILQRTVKSRALKVLSRIKKEASTVSVEILPGVHFQLSVSGGVVSISSKNLGNDPDSLFENLMESAQKLERKDKLKARGKRFIQERSED